MLDLGVFVYIMATHYNIIDMMSYLSDSWQSSTVHARVAEEEFSHEIQSGWGWGGFGAVRVQWPLSYDLVEIPAPHFLGQAPIISLVYPVGLQRLCVFR